MVGGKESVLKEAQPIPLAVGSSVTLTGPIGVCNFAKLANQIIVACNIAVMGPIRHVSQGRRSPPRDMRRAWRDVSLPWARISRAFGLNDEKLFLLFFSA